MTYPTSATPAAIEAHGLVKTFGAHRAVDNVDLVVPTGSVYGVLGPNGAGKTTTVRMLATLLRPTSGSATVFGHDVVREPVAVRSLIGVTGQYASVDEALSGRQNLIVFARLLGKSRAQARALADDLLEEFGLTDAATRPLNEFSGGMRRRLDLAASLITSPPLLFLDEPTTGLDPRTRTQMWETIRRLVSQGSTVLLTTQYLDEADQLADRIAVIDRGTKIADGTADELKDSVGANTLRLRPTNTADAIAVLSIAERVIGHSGTLSPEAGRVTIAIPDTTLISEVMVALVQAGIAINELAVEKPSLDEVFMTITGQPTQEDAA